jgi:hypothetical protein
MRKLKLTPIFILLFLGLLLYLSYFIMSLINGYQEGAYVAGYVSLIIIGVIVIERVIVRFSKVDKRQLWISEIVVLVLFFTVPYLFNSKQVYAQVEKPVKWFVVLATENESEVDFKYIFPKHFSFRISNEDVFRLNRKDAHITIDAQDWNGNKSMPFTIKINNGSVKYIVYSAPDYDLTKDDNNKIDKLIKKKVTN